MASWRTLEGVNIENVYNAIREEHELAIANDRQLYAYIGTDSQNLGKRGTSFVQCIALHIVNELGTGKGGRVFDIRFLEKVHSVRFTRLLREVELTIKLWRKVSVLFDELGIPLEVHVDIASNPKWGSYEAYKVSKGWLNGLGIEAVFKPNAWVASIVADRHTRGIKSNLKGTFNKMKKRKGKK